MANKSYATLQQMADPGYTNIDITTMASAYGTTLLRMLENAAEEIDHICHRHFDCYEGIEYLDGAGDSCPLSEDVLSITEVAVDVSGSGSYSALSSTDYRSYPLGTRIYPKTSLKVLASRVGAGFAPGIPAGIRITGVFGYGNGESSTPYRDSGITITVATITGTSLTLSAEGTIQAGHTIKVESEQIYISAVTSDGSKTAMAVRGVNGTIAASHSLAAAYIYQYPGPVVEANLILATAWWKQRENPAIFMAGNNETGTYTITKNIENIVKAKLYQHIRKGWWGTRFNG